MHLPLPRNFVPIALFWAAALVASGCDRAPPRTIDYVIGQRKGMATLTLAGTTIIFQGIPHPGPDAERKAGGVLTVSGTGTGGGSSSVDGMTVSYSYTGGSNAIAIGNYGFKIIENGARLRFGSRLFPLGAGTQTIVVSRDGAAQVGE